MPNPKKTWALVLFVLPRFLGAQDTIQAPLKVDAGSPLRVYITDRLTMKVGKPVRARLIEPVYSFDRIVLPAGVEIDGTVTALDPVTKMKRTQAMLNGDFSPLHFARVAFTEVHMPDGRTIPIHTASTEGLPTLYAPARPSKKKPSASSSTPTVTQRIGEQLHQQVSAKTQGVLDAIRGPNKIEWAEDFLIHKLPYHPQWYRRNTRFDAVLEEPLQFGTTEVRADALRSVGVPASESIAEVRLLTPLSSLDAGPDTKIEGVLSQPLFSPDNKLLLPEGTHLTGRVRSAQPARWFHRGGNLRFTFDRIEPPAFTAVAPVSLERTPAQLAAAETDPQAHVKVDPEGGARATEPKTRLLGPVAALLVATRAMDNDEGKNHLANGTANANYGGRALGGFSGFGLLGTAASRASQNVGTALGMYGLAWSVYLTVISRGNEVEFQKNSAIEVRFGPPPAPLVKQKGKKAAKPQQ